MKGSLCEDLTTSSFKSSYRNVYASDKFDVTFLTCVLLKKIA